MTDTDEKQDAEFMKALQKGFQNMDDAPPGEIGLARLKRDIQREQEQQQQAKPKQTYWKPLAIAACFLMGVQFFLLLPKEQTDSGIVTLSGTAAHNGPTLQLVFKNDASAQQIQQALNGVQGTIINGPGALGIYTVALPKGENYQQALTQLQNLEFVDEVIAQQGDKP